MNLQSIVNNTFNDHRSVTISVIIPALNEADNIAAVVTDMRRHLASATRSYEIIVADNNSTDATADIARAAGAKVVTVKQPGYGAACWVACEKARGDVLLFVDGDGSTCIADSAQLLEAIDAGADLVIGARVSPEPGSMSAAQMFGNWLACRLLRLLWGIPTSDLGPHRAIRHSSFQRLQLHDRGFGWTVEMQIKAALHQLAVTEVAVQWHARTYGYSKIGGTFTGIVRAGVGILGKIAQLWVKHPFRSNPTLFQPLTDNAKRPSTSAAQASSPTVQDAVTHSCSQTH